MHPAEPPSPDGRSRLSDAEISRMLRLGISRTRRERPVDELLERLCMPGADAWIRDALGSASPLGPSLQEELVDGKADLDRVKAIKDIGKSIYRKEKDDDVRLAGLAAYFAAIAAALAHHAALTTSIEPDKLEKVLPEISAVMPEPWKGLLERGANACKDKARLPASGKPKSGRIG